MKRRKMSGRPKNLKADKDAGFIPPPKYDEPRRGNKKKAVKARDSRLEKAAL